LNDIVAASLLDYLPSNKFDVIDAEGFIYTIQPNSAWIKKAAQCLANDGFFIISYMEMYGGFFELLTKAIYQFIARDPAYGAGIGTAKKLFLPKWNSVQHTRKIDSWFMDVIENPFVRRKYFIDPVDLLKDMHAGGFRLYSSWPNYRDTLAMEWIKAPLVPENELHASISFVEQSRLSHLLGCKCFSHDSSPGFSDDLASLVRVTDGLIDSWSQQACAEAETSVGNIIAKLTDSNTATGDKNVNAAIEVLLMAKTVFNFMESNSVNRLADFCRSDKTFISTWGMPNHYGIFQRRDSGSLPRQD
jgi:hypothetical protein